MKLASSCVLHLFLLWSTRTNSFAPTSHSVDGCSSSFSRSRQSLPVPLKTAGADIEQETEQSVSPPASNSDDGPTFVANRGKVNEIDFCIAPADVSLSRSYSSSSTTTTTSNSDNNNKSLSLTRALNNASNRAVRRILLARSWPSAEALNLSLRQVLAAEQSKRASDIPLEEQRGASATDSTTSTAKCPVPRPILNILVRRRGDVDGKDDNPTQPMPRSRTDDEYVADQLSAFRERYSAIPGFSMAEAYLECVLSLATSGVESPRVAEVMQAGVYDESYRRVVAVLKSVGTVFEEVPGTRQLRIAQKLVNQDICLSMLDKMNMKQELMKVDVVPKTREETVRKKEVVVEDQALETESVDEADKSDPKFRPLQFLRKSPEIKEQTDDDDGGESEREEFELEPSDLGGVLLSAEEPSMTRQLNALSNIVQRTLLFGGDQELLVLSETLEADAPAFVQRWYPSPIGEVELLSPEEETRPGVQYLNCLVSLLKECYNNGVVTNLDPPLPLLQSYANAYERLTASLVELGSGYVKPAGDVMSMPVPRTAQEELGRFAVWESTFRTQNKQPDISSYPEDLEGSWEVKDEIGGETIGISTVVFRPQGQVEVAPPMQGLRWRLDPGPTHLDTCTFQVMGEDRTILQYRGFIDRGARLEARFSKRRMRIRGSVMFQMRDGESAYLGDGYWRDMLPVNYKTGTTKFVMTKN